MIQPLNRTLQENILCMLCYDDKHGRIVANSITPDLFEGDFRTITKQWSAKTVWLNPPFNQWDDWVPKALHEFDSRRTKEMCILSLSTISTAGYFNETVIRCNALLVPRHRWNFWGPKATKGNASPAGSFLYYFGPNRERFRDVFKHLGAIKGDF